MKYIIEDQLPIKTIGKKKIIEWEKMNDYPIDFVFDDIKGTLYVTFKEKVDKNKILTIKYDDKEIDILSSNFLKCRISKLIKNKFSRCHKYEVNEIVNGLKILEKTSMKNSRNHNILAYKVKCLFSGEIYTKSQNNLVTGYGSPFASKTKVSSLNWLYNHKNILPYLENIEDAKFYTESSSKKIKCKCKYCRYKKSVTCSHLTKNGFSCPNCSTNISYPERFVMAYLTVKNIEFIHQYKLKNQRRFIDFYLPNENIAIECHGIQHFEDTCVLWKDSLVKSKQSDEIKRQYCKENNIKLIELDCRKSEFDFIRQSIFNSELENISNDLEKQMKKIMIDSLHRTDIKDILNDYQSYNYTVSDIARKYNVSNKYVNNLAEKFGVRRIISRKKSIFNNKTNKIYNSITEASKTSGDSLKYIQTKLKENEEWYYYI